MFDNNRLVGYLAAHCTKWSACIVSAMVHPKYREQGIYLNISNDLLERISIDRTYVFLFSNELIRPIHIKKEGFIEVYQIKEYRIPIEYAKEWGLI